MPHIIVTQLDEPVHMVLFWVAQDGLCTFCIAGDSLDFHKGAFSLIADNKVNLQTGVFVKVVELATHFRKNIGNKPLENSTFIA